MLTRFCARVIDLFNRHICWVYRSHLYGESKWHSDISAYGRRCHTCKRLKPHPWFSELLPRP